MFMIAGENRPWVPVGVLAAIGVVLLATAGTARARTAPASREAKEAPVIDPDKAALNKRLEAIAWACYLIGLGGYLLVPSSVIVKGVWTIAVGVIMLGLNAARYANGLNMSGFTTGLGVILVVLGILQAAGMEAIEGPLVLIIFGVFMLIRPWVEKQRLFGKAEEA
jgi:hypothetical protein